MTEYTPSTATTDDIFSWLLSITSEEEVRAVRRWLAEHTRQVAERAWAEGYRQGWGDRDEDFHAGYVPSGFEQDTLNPYRKDNTND